MTVLDSESHCATPLVSVDGVFVKLECLHPTGSVKDRIVQYILQESRLRGDLRPGMRIVEATSGNTGISLAYHGRQMGHQVTIVMPEHMNEERKEVIRRLGADLVLCSQEGGFAEAARIRDEICLGDPQAFNPDQFSNPLNAECHERFTGIELIASAQKPIDAFVAGVGTGGTLIGVGRALKRFNPDVRIVAVEPTESPVLSGGEGGTHGIFGIGDGFIPALASDGAGGPHPMIDEIALVSTEEATATAAWLADCHGLCVGISSGANLAAARRLVERYETVATIFPDGFWKYQSCGLARHHEGACPFQRQCENTIIGREMCGLRQASNTSSAAS